MSSGYFNCLAVTCASIISNRSMCAPRVLLPSLLLTLGACNDHKRPSSFDAKPSENKATPYNGVAQGEQEK
jgi:hypothetical protein